MTKNCLSCAFCTRNQETWHSSFYKPELSHWEYNQESLTADQREALKKGDERFIEKEIREAKAWDEEYKNRKEHEKQREEELATNNPLAALILGKNSEIASMFGQKENDAEKYGLAPKPEAPDEDYLSCFHEQWDENKDKEIQKNRRGFLENKKCSRYFPFGKIGNETLKACEENRKDAQESSRFKVTVWLIVAGIVVTGFGIVATIWMGILAIPAPGKIEAPKPALVAPVSDKQAMPVKAPTDSIKKSRAP